MRLERLAIDKFKVFLTFDDMEERGITKEDLWQDVPKVHDLFRDMMLEADDELGFKVDGPIAVEVFAMPAQGMVFIVTKGTQSDEYDTEDYEDGFIEMQLTLDEIDDIFYEFKSFEDVVGLIPRLNAIDMDGGELYSYQDRFFLKLSDDDLEQINEDALVAILSEFGSPATISFHRIAEYGKKLIETNTIAYLFQTFYAPK
ncbi:MULTISPECIES: genetic competence negative regulator [Shouchella]|uniref:Adapter protein MecA n=2 Tax=Bacillaceae TaxID=186817 RepID=A0A060LTU6_9BACI|nr:MULTISPECIES: genetic competence negative regulator [Bacillaceae]AIC94641.1 adapter protein MecA [Shouchella lehensis G1]KQL51805.1 adaptor protein [Alkalicoccobacillus plakortidis]RQW20505.1 genetic competence negative regulator [Bacillus sp. C1-1]